MTNYELRSVAFGEEELRNYELLQPLNLLPCGAAAIPQNSKFNLQK